MATYYWVGGSGTWDNTSNTNWSLSSGGAGGAGVPNAADNVNFDANSGTAATVTVAGTAVANIVTIDKSDITLSLSGSPTFSNTVTLTAGTITLGSNSLTALAFSSGNTNARTINFGTGRIIVTGNNTNSWSCLTTTNLVITGSRIVEANYSGSVGTRNLYHASAEANSVSFYVSAGTDSVNILSNATDIDFTGFAGTFVVGGRTIFGSLTLSTGMTVAAGASITTFGATSGTKTITSNGKTIDFPIIFNGIGGTWKPTDTLTLGSTRSMTLTNGTFDADGKNITVGTFATAAGGAKVLTMGSGTWTVAGATWNTNADSVDVTVNAGTSTITMTSGSAKTFSGGGKTFNVLNQGGAGNLTIAQSNTFANITNTIQPATVRLTAGTTQTVSALGLAGTSGNLITLDTTVAGTRATIYKATGSISLSFVSIKDIAATGGANFNAFTSNGCVNGGNNSGWDFNSVLYPTIYTVRKTKRYFLN